jgi:hypothetical protein
MFGVEAKVGLTSSSLPDEIISKISTEDDLKDSTNTGFRNDFDIIEITDARRSDKYIHLFLQARFGLLHICPAFLHAHLFVSHLFLPQQPHFKKP